MDSLTPDYWVSALAWSKDGNSLVVSTKRAIFCVDVHSNQLLFCHTHAHGCAAAIQASPHHDATYLIDFIPCMTHETLGTGVVLLTPQGLKPFKHECKANVPLLTATFSVTSQDEFFMFQAGESVQISKSELRTLLFLKLSKQLPNGLTLLVAGFPEQEGLTGGNTRVGVTTEVCQIQRAKYDGSSTTTLKAVQYEQPFPQGITKSYRSHPLRRGR